MKLGVALTGHWLDAAATLRLARLAEARGIDLLIVDGDETAIPRRPEAPLVDGGSLSAAVLSATRALRVGSIHLPGFMHPALLARQLATLSDLGAGRAFGFFGVGAGRHAKALGLPELGPGERVQLLDDTLRVIRQLLAGQPASGRVGAYEFENVRTRAPREGVPLVVAAAGRRTLRVAEAHADVLDMNVPPLPAAVGALRSQLSRRLETWLWVFARPEATADATLADYRRLCPWFASAAEHELRDALLYGNGEAWRERLATRGSELGVDRWILDLCGLDEPSAARAIELATANGNQIP